MKRRTLLAAITDARQLKRNEPLAPSQSLMEAQATPAWDQRLAPILLKLVELIMGVHHMSYLHCTVEALLFGLKAVRSK